MSRVISEAKLPVHVQLFVYRDYGRSADRRRAISPFAGSERTFAMVGNSEKRRAVGANDGEAIEQALLANRAGRAVRCSVDCW